MNNDKNQKKRAAIILAAGKGKRMKSDLPKVLHEIDGKPMVSILMDTLTKLNFEKLVMVVGHKGELVQQALRDYPVEFAWQREQMGTGHAVMATQDLMGNFKGLTLVAAGDVPFLSKDSIESLFSAQIETQAIAACLSAEFSDPAGYGRIVRTDDGRLLKEIVEHKDATVEQLDIKEINSGTFCFDNRELFAALERVKNNNAQGEYYLTDTVKILHDKGLRVAVVKVKNPDEVLGVNSIQQLDEIAGKFGLLSG